MNAGACTLWLRGYLARVFSCENEAGESLVMKLSPPIALPEVEAAALRHWDGDGAARLRDFDREAGALLLDRIVPGAPLPPNDEALAITAAASVLRRLHAKPPPLDGVIPLMPEALVWWEGLARSEAEPLAVGTSLLPQAMAAARALAASTSARVLLHGDFLAKNILAAADGGWVAIDPMPRIGDPASDIGFFAAGYPGASALIERARALAHVLGFDEPRAARWAAIWAIGEACETWREDSDELQALVATPEFQRLLDA